jgi:lysophospholipase L1-like esterase
VGGALPDGGRTTATKQNSDSPSATGTERKAAPKPAPVWNVHPSSVAALGDSITRGFDACGPLSDCPEVSWATGSSTQVDSLSSRLSATTPATRSWNVAKTGAKVADLPAQARSAAAHKPAMVTVLIGANDACTTTPDKMTSEADFRADFSSTLAYLHQTLPNTQILVASVPDLERLWSVGRTNRLGKQVWRLGDVCQSMLKDPDSQTTAAQQRRTEVADRVVAYNTSLGQVCAQYQRCRYDGGAVFDYRFSSDELSTWDFFHPDQSGQEALARIMAGVAFTAKAP